MSISLNLSETVGSFTKKVNSSLAKVFSEILFKKKNRIDLDIRMFVEQQILAQPEVTELLNNNGPGSLTAMLGITNTEALNGVNAIVKTITRAVKVNLDQIDDRLNGGLEVVISGVDAGDIPEAIKTVPNSKLNWLEWLLEKGDTPIIIGYRYSASDKGRVGGGIMKPGGVFRIPPAFSGTEEENFIIRALVGEPQQQEIERIIRKALNV
tara:strand:+ start:2282 stop:2911 length:630 start_codon:yes stop_codon:yes gene_type:complete